MQLKVFQVDAFTSSLFKGNPAAVVILENEIPDELMQNIAFENNLSETAYILINKSPIEIRWFSPTAEVDLCGHATLASAKILFKHYLQMKNKLFLIQKWRANSYTKRQPITLNFPSDTFEKVDNNDEVNQAANTCSKEIYKVEMTIW